MWRVVGLLTVAAGVVTFSIGMVLEDVGAVAPAALPVATASPAAKTPPPPAPEPAMAPMPAPTPTPVPRSFDSLATVIDAIISASGAQVGVSLIELGGTSPSSWEEGGSLRIDAASTYKLAALMDEAQAIAKGTTDPNGLVCYQDSDWEYGWFDDYAGGTCLTRDELAQRAGIFSDNTAGHMLVRDLGGSDAVNAFAAEMGAQDSSFYDPNLTTPDDLAQLLRSEAAGNAGGAAAQVWLYPQLVNTQFEAGLPAGVPAGIRVVHKTGEFDSVTDDAGLVSGGAHGDYVLAVLTDGLGGDAGWRLIAQLSAAVWAYEAGR
jgi:beta-lactamase class A